MPVGYAALILREKIQDLIDATDWKEFDTPLTMEKGIELWSSLITSVKKCDKMLEMIKENGEKK